MANNIEEIIDGTLGNYTGSKLEIELFRGNQPHYAKPYPIPKIHKKTQKTKVDRLIKKRCTKTYKKLKVDSSKLYHS